MKPNRKIQKEVKKDMVAYGIKDYKTNWSDYQEKNLSKSILALSIALAIITPFTIAMFIYTTYLLTK